MASRSLLLVILFCTSGVAQTVSAPDSAAPPAASIASEAPKPDVTFPKMDWTGDIRLRAMSEKKGDDQSRLNQRIRVRFGLGALIQKDLRAEIRIATAKGSRSTNQTLGDNSEPGSRRRFVGLDLAYAKWYPKSFFTLYAGRFPQIHFAPGGSEVILDDDLALEGAGLVSEYEFAGNFFVFGSMGSTFIRENYDNYYSEELSDNMINFGQAGLKWKFERIQLAVGGGFFNFTSVKGKNFADLAVGGKASGNSEASGVVVHPYLPKQYFTEMKFPMGPVDGKIFYEMVKNNEAATQNNAQWAGLEIGQKSWDFSMAYVVVESDAVMAMFSQSDVGDGVTDVRGWVGKARWKFARNMNLRLTQMVNRTDMSGFNKEYRRTHLDLSASF